MLFAISVSSLFLKYSYNFANFSLAILIKYIFIEIKECALICCSFLKSNSGHLNITFPEAVDRYVSP